ncbi:DUF3048 domain-containing protein [Paenibacillus albicereus]|uniref:DUF3048 domain-containing protein n=1 Tax=Paenibacillus albicereus TaxID=2726185 RepID=A0A6H2H1I9_9BACL|nr:DUF3048 domain-containing protein [Paenibacillus albicereus]QJC53554.1 DUF3048 domain-containing protein [Paenibacillus albicereus]
MSGTMTGKGLLLAAAASMLLSACSQAADAPAETAGPPSAVASPTASPSPTPSAAPAFTAPLTGEAAQGPIDSRPYLVMINNHAKARPQSGLGSADLVYEVLAEGEITRFLAVFQSRAFDGAIGPVRSIRPYFIDVGKSLDAVLIHSGGSPDGYGMLSREKLDHMDEITNAGAYFWRDKSRKAPHNLYTSLEKLAAGSAKKGFETTQRGAVRTLPFVSDPEQAPPGRPSSGLEVTFLLESYKVSYAYDAAARTYKRAINGEPHVDQNDGKQLEAANVVVLEAPHRVLDDVGRREVDLDQGGRAVLFQRGLARDVEWKRGGEQDLIRFYESETEVPLYPGQTHVLIVPEKPGLDQRLSVLP